jgi:hypothetical protein
MIVWWDHLLGFLCIKHCVAQWSVNSIEVYRGWVLCYTLNVKGII